MYELVICIYSVHTYYVDHTYALHARTTLLNCNISRKQLLNVRISIEQHKTGNRHYITENNQLSVIYYIDDEDIDPYKYCYNYRGQ